MQRSSMWKTSGIALVSAVLLAACASGESTSPEAPSSAPASSVNDTDALLANASGEIRLWSWTPDIDVQLDICRDSYPNITIIHENQGVGEAQYEKLRTALSSGAGVPDVAHIAYNELPGFVALDALSDLTEFGADNLEADYAPGPWGSVALGGGVYGLPWDSGPMGLLYRADILEANGIDVPVTWQDFESAARQLRAADSSAYLTTFAPANATWFQGLLWQGGSKPFTVNGNELTIQINDDAAKKVAAYWDRLITEDLVATQPDFTDDWYRSLSAGTIASWVTAAWGPSFLQGVAGDSSGLWRAAPMPQWSSSVYETSEYGGSSMAVLKASQNKPAAYVIARCLMNEEESSTMWTTKQLLFPSKNAILNSPEFVGLEAEFYGGTPVNAMYAEASAAVVSGWEWAPIQSFVSSEISAQVGAAAASGGIEAALDRVQAAVVEYAERQGFSVVSGR